LRRLGLLLLVLAAALPSAASAAAPVTVALDRDSVSTQLGQHFAFGSTIRNETGRPLRGLVAHLNVLSLDPGVYVDPEDWSSHRTLYLSPLPAHSSRRLDWRVQAVNSGRFVVYVAVVRTSGGDAVAPSGALRATVAHRQALNSGGVLPLALAVPAGLLLLLGVNLRRRRGRA
jgi:hypothetical protein